MKNTKVLKKIFENYTGSKLEKYNQRTFSLNMDSLSFGGKRICTQEVYDNASVKMLELQAMASKTEHIIAEILMDKGIKFYHKYPLCVNGEVKFIDFYFPQSKKAIHIVSDSDMKSNQSRAITYICGINFSIKEGSRSVAGLSAYIDSCKLESRGSYGEFYSKAKRLNG